MTDSLIFEEKHMIATILYLHRNGRSRKIDIYDNVSTNPRMPDKLRILEANGLIEMSDNYSGRGMDAELTELGELVAELFVTMDKIMTENNKI